MIQTKRIYDQPDAKDGYRVLVDRLWPRGISKSAAQLDEWLKDIAPSNDLRAWFDHAPERWDGFVKRYRAELLRAEHTDTLARLRAISGLNTVTLLFAARSEDHNNAAVLKDVLDGDGVDSSPGYRFSPPSTH